MRNVNLDMLRTTINENPVVDRCEATSHGYFIVHSTNPQDVIIAVGVDPEDPSTVLYSTYENEEALSDGYTLDGGLYYDFANDRSYRRGAERILDDCEYFA